MGVAQVIRVGRSLGCKNVSAKLTNTDIRQFYFCWKVILKISNGLCIYQFILSSVKLNEYKRGLSEISIIYIGMNEDVFSNAVSIKRIHLCYQIPILRLSILFSLFYHIKTSFFLTWNCYDFSVCTVSCKRFNIDIIDVFKMSNFQLFKQVDK